MIDDALRTAAYERGIEVRLMGSHWEHSPCDMRSFLESLGSWNNTGPKNGIIKTVSICAHTVHVTTCTCILNFHGQSSIQYFFYLKSNLQCTCNRSLYTHE